MGPIGACPYVVVLNATVQMTSSGSWTFPGSLNVMMFANPL